MIETILGLLTGGTSWITAAFAGLLAALAGGIGLYVKGRSDAKTKAKAEAEKARADTLERIINAPVLDADKPADVAAARDRLRKRAK